MPTDKLKIYIGCSLTHAPEEFKTQIIDLKNQLRSRYDVTEFLGTIKGTPHDVYQWDIQTCLAGCDLFVAVCDYPAIGLGYELGTALEAMKKPVLAVAHTDAHVSRLLLGIELPHYRFERYNNPQDLPSIIDQAITTFNLK
ncbi:MAG TPA: hypothetical protein VHQ86_02195 [Candidatus Saccharimonadia bacterium]|jgi:hypothetical protein|nr:hypothetical protein [Candidatus Saccharimonadia bacterium]